MTDVDGDMRRFVCVVLEAERNARLGLSREEIGCCGQGAKLRQWNWKTEERWTVIALLGQRFREGGFGVSGEIL